MTPAWMELALLEAAEDVREVPGVGDNPRIIDYHRATVQKATEDEVPWCSAFACWAMENAGIKSPQDAVARTWEAWGTGIQRAPQGAVVVMWRESRSSWKGHVGFLMASSVDRVLVLGGNQGDAVSIRSYPKSQVLSYRWPRAAEIGG